MEWTSIILAIISLVGGGLGGFFLRKPKKQQEEAKALQELEVAIKDGLQMIANLTREKDELLDQHHKEICELYDQLNEKRNECTTKGYNLCVHLGCPLRKPTLGRGKIWFDSHKNDPVLGADYDSLDVLIEKQKYEHEAEMSQLKKNAADKEEN